MGQLHEPWPYEQDKMGCEVAALANVAAVLDGEISTFEAVNAQLGRVSGETVNQVRKFRWALEHRGYAVTFIGAFDNRRLEAEGVDYAVEYYGAFLPKGMMSWVRMQYESNLEQMLDEGRQLSTYLAPFERAGVFQDVLRRVTPQDIDSALAKQSVVLANVLSPMPHAVLIYGRVGRKGPYKVFYPRYSYSESEPAFILASSEKFRRLGGEPTSLTVYSKRV